MEEKIKKLAKFGSAVGIEHFILMAKHDNMVTFHVQKTAIGDAMAMMIAGFYDVIRMEVEAHPEFSPEFLSLHTDLEKKFSELIRESNAKFAEFKKNNPSSFGKKETIKKK